MKIAAILLSVVLVPAMAAAQPATTATDQSTTQTQDSNMPPAASANAPAATAKADPTCAKPGKTGKAKASGDARSDSVKAVTRETGDMGTRKVKKPDKETACADQPQ
jgi:hypothetical protein